MATAPCPPRLRALVDLAAALSNVQAGQILSNQRCATVARARFAVYFGGYHGLFLTKTAIARALGDRDHATVVHGLRRAEALRGSAPDFRTLTDCLLAATTAEL